MALAASLPKYVQISERLIREIAAGHLTDGARLPPERDMAAELGISVGTLRKALSDLDAKGMLTRVQGSGNYIRAGDAAGSVYAFFRLEKPGGGGLPGAEILSVRPRSGRPDCRVRRTRLLDGRAVALEEIFFEAGGRDVAESDLSESLYLYYRDTLGRSVVSVEDTIAIDRMPDWGPLSARAPCGHVMRIGRDGDGKVLEISQTWFDPARAAYVSRMGSGKRV